MEIPDIIKALRRNMVETGSLVCIGCGREHNCSTHGCAIMREAADALEKLNRRASPENKPDWISVSEGLPDTTVIGCDEWGNVEPVLYIAPIKKWKIMPNACIEMNVIYWQPLPQPPKGTRKPEGSSTP